MIQVYKTARDTADRLTRQPDVPYDPSLTEWEGQLVNVHPEVTCQTITGFGAAFTEAAAVTLHRMGPERRRQILDAYFKPGTGLEYSLCRTHINSCDFSLGNYCYVDDGTDTGLESFTIERDRRHLIPMIREAVAVKGSGIRLLASPWSPPPWMKTSGAMNKGGKLLAQHCSTWARYVARYLKEYAAEELPVWAVTVQNEPKAVQPWDSCVYTAEEERDFVRDHLGPELARQGLDTRILVWDHNRERLFERSSVVFSDRQAARYVWGSAFHWYSGDHFEAASMVHDRFPDKHLLFTEGCQEGGVHEGSWETGERYGHHMIGDLNNWTEGWIDWNMLLDEQGGPNHVGNFCDAPVIADTRTDTVRFNSSYYYIGHVTRFVPPGSRRIGLSRYTDRLECAAFLRPDGCVAVVALNRTDTAIGFNLRSKAGVGRLSADGHSIMTLLFGTAR